MAEVAVTGIGIICSLGAGTAACADALAAGRRFTRMPVVEFVGTPLSEIEVAALPAFDAAAMLGTRKTLKFMSDSAVLGCIAAREAAADAEIATRFAPGRVGLFAGTGVAGINLREVQPVIQSSIDEAGEFSCRMLGERGLPASNPLTAFKLLANMPGCLVSLQETVRGANYLFSPWEGQTAAAIIEAYEAVGSGEVDCTLCGAADFPVHPATLAYLSQANLLDENPPAAGAAYVVLERLDNAPSDKIHAVLQSVSALPETGDVDDPLACLLGRTYAAAPALLLAIACVTGQRTASIRGVDGYRFTAQLASPSQADLQGARG